MFKSWEKNVLNSITKKKPKGNGKPPNRVKVKCRIHIPQNSGY